MKSLMVRVSGVPAPQGSKRHVGHGVMVESSKRIRPWRESVKVACLDQMDRDGVELIDGWMFQRGTPVAVDVDFVFTRPKSHYRTGRNADQLRSDAPNQPTTKPDVDKLLRGILDALVDAHVVVDDSQVVNLIGSKGYGPPGAWITVEAVA